mmetsp:Transcript_30683/g.69907  ORF Transcript_30683/g.69907 Transcript_30683/m.69907 type:complete len:234 (-) Transcript_30683:1006-1707(-)
MEKRTFHGANTMCMTQSFTLGPLLPSSQEPSSTSSSSSSSPPLTHTASRICSHQLAWPTFALSQFTARALMSLSTRSFPACSDSMKMVRMQESAPPSLSGSNLAPPEAAVRIKRKFSVRSYLPRALILIWILACVSPLLNVSNPSSPSKSCPDRAEELSVLYRHVTLPVQPCFRSTTRSTMESSTCSGTLTLSSGKDMTPGKSSSMITIVARLLAPSTAQLLGASTFGQKRSM